MNRCKETKDVFVAAYNAAQLKVFDNSSQNKSRNSLKEHTSDKLVERHFGALEKAGYSKGSILWRFCMGSVSLSDIVLFKNNDVKFKKETKTGEGESLLSVFERTWAFFSHDLNRIVKPDTPATFIIIGHHVGLNCAEVLFKESGQTLNHEFVRDKNKPLYKEGSGFQLMTSVPSNTDKDSYAHWTVPAK